MVKETKLYDLLGVSSDASDNELKKGYRKQALKFHPDKPTGDTEKFKEISEAFDILSDSDKRHLYDSYGLEAARRGGPMPEPDAGAGAGSYASGGFPGGFPGGAGGSPFSGFSSSGGGPQTFHFSSGGPGAGGAGGNPFHSFSTNDAFNIFSHFTQSEGLGSDDDDIFGMPRGGFSQFQSSGGRPQSMPRRRPGPSGAARAGSPERSTVTVKLPLTLEDLYSGVTKKMKIRRRNRSGSSEEKILQISIKPGWKAGTKITFSNEGDAQPDGSSQDVIFVVEEKPHPRFKRVDNDLTMDLKLSLKEALAGFSRIVETLDGKKLKVENKNPLNPGHVIRFPGHGMPISKRPGERGDLVITIKVDFPSKLTDAQRKAIEENF